MKIVFLNARLDVKQYHLACALADRYRAQCYFLHYPFTRFLPLYQRLKFIGKKVLYGHNDFVDECRKDPHNPFHYIGPFSLNTLQTLDPDLVYISHLIDWVPEKVFSYPIFYDVEDFILVNRDFLPAPTIAARMACYQWFLDRPLVGVGCSSPIEQERFSKYYHCQAILLYPFVAKRTVPKFLPPKHEDFSVVYAWGISRVGYRDFYTSFQSILQAGIPLTCFMNNSHSPKDVKYICRLQSYPHFTFYKHQPYGIIKEKLAPFHVGLIGQFVGYDKMAITYGMKPLEYAYAGVQPATLGYPLCNLSNGREFSYSPIHPKWIQEKYDSRLDQFDFEYHLMDHHVTELMEVCQ